MATQTQVNRLIKKLKSPSSPASDTQTSLISTLIKDCLRQYDYLTQLIERTPEALEPRLKEFKAKRNKLDQTIEILGTMQEQC